MPLTHKDVAEIIGQLRHSGMDELVMSVGGVRIEARKKGVQPSVSSAPTSAPAVPAPAAAPLESATPLPEAGAPSEQPVPPGMHSVNSPMVGTFFSRPAPDQPPFVTVGSRVEEGEPVCLVEVMKLYTTLYAPAAGIIREVRAEDAGLVEYGQVLFVIEPA